MRNKFEGFIDLGEINVPKVCCIPNCKEKVVGSTVFTEKVKGLNVDKIHLWCKKHYEEVLDGKVKHFTSTENKEQEKNGNTN